MKHLLVAIAALCIAASASYAQQVSVPGVQAVGTPQAPNVAVWFNPTTLSDSGVPLSGLTAGVTSVVAHDPIAASIAATTLSIGVLPKPANTVLAGPTSGSPGAVTARPLTNADMPVPTTTALGGVEAILHVAHEWIDSISTLGVPNLSQPAFTDISGTLTGGQVASNTITNGNLAQMPADTVKCNNTGISATPIDCTVTQLKAFVNSAPQVTVLTTGSVSPYSTPSGALYIVVEMAGAGGGGSGSGGAGVSSGGDGGNSTFSTLTATGGKGGAAGSTDGGSGGTSSGGDINETGGQGGASGGAAGFTNNGAPGGSNAFGGGATPTLAAGNAGAGFGAGGSGGAFTGTGSTSAGGGAGAYVRKLIASPGASLTFSIGSHGTAGNAGASGSAGGIGADGIAVVSAYFQ